MEIIKKLHEEYGTAFIASALGVTRRAVLPWLKNSNAITFKNINKFYEAGLITEKERIAWGRERGAYLKTIKGRRGDHLKRKNG